jgi:parvulin-like peptidyl-prolyl isomerase
VGDYAVLERELNETLAAILRIYQRNSGQQVPPEGMADFQRGVLEQLIRQKLMRAEAKRRGLTVSDAEAEEQLRRDPYFHPGGSFDLNLWAEFTSNPVSYESAMREARELLAGRLLLEQTTKRITPSDADLELYYSAQHERVAINAVLIDEAWFRNDTDLTATAIRAHYDSLKAGQGSEVTVFVELFIVPFPGDAGGASPSRQAEKEAAQRSDSVLAVIRGGTSFDQVASDFGGIREGGVWTTGRETGVFYGDPELGELALAAGQGEVLARALRVPGGYAAVRIKSKNEKEPPPLGQVAASVIDDYERTRLFAIAQEREAAIREANPDSFITVCTTWHAALVDTALIEVKDPSRKKLEKWYEENERNFVRLDPEGRGLITPPFEELEDLAREGYLSAEKLRVAEETAAKIARAWQKGKRDRKQEKKAQVWYELTTTTEQVRTADIPPILADSAAMAAVGRAGVLKGSRGYAVFAVASRDESCPVPEDEAIRRTYRILEAQRAHDREFEARRLYDNHRDRYITEPTYHHTAIDIDIRTWEIVELTDEEIESFYRRNESEFGTPPEVRVRHILLATPPGSDAVQSEARARDLAAAARAGADFDSLVRNFSDDRNTREQGGDTGFLTRSGAPPGFENFLDTAFALSPGQVGGPVRSPYGFHVLQCVEQKEGNLQPLDIVRSNLTSMLAREKAEQIAQQMANTAITGFDSKQDLMAWAEDKSFATFDISWRPGTRAMGPAILEEVQADLQSTPAPGVLPGTYFLAPRFVVVYLDSVAPPQPASWGEAKEKALADVDRGRRLHASEQAGKTVLAELNSGLPWSEAAAPWGGGTTDLDVGKGFVVSGIGRIPALDTLLFGEDPQRLADTESGIASTEAGALVVEVIGRRSVSQAEFATVVDSLRNQAVERALYEYFEDLKQRHKVTILRADLQMELPPPPPLLSAVEPEKR